ncbi:MAG: TerB family tellurite resistance protein, partial [Polyangiaceae bacterium]|nr:TerB family tellurite resistance protein [Polyangiaceae bacterium]
RRLLADLLCTTTDALPPDVDERIEAFDYATFDLGTAARAFLKDPPMRKRRLLELVSQLANADGELDLSEDEFLRALAKHLEMDPAEYEDLVLDYEMEELRESFAELRARPVSLPPPVPKRG